MKIHDLEVTGSLIYNGVNLLSLTSSVTDSGSFSTQIVNLNQVSSSLNSFTSSINTTIKSKLDSESVISGSAQVSITDTTGYSTFSSSISSSIGSLSGSVATTTSGLAGRIGTIEGRYATTGSNAFIGTQTITGSLYISSDLVVQGSSSLQNITASAVNIGANIVNLNTANPAIRFAGLNIFDSGSIGGSGSFLYDAVQDEFIFIHRGDGTNVTSSVVMMGPQTYNNVGSEIYPTNNRILKGTGNEHIGDSCIIDDGTTVCVNANLIGSGTISGTNIYASTVTCSPVGKFTSCIDAGSGTFSGAISGTCATFTNNVNITNTGGAMALSFKRTDSPVGTGAIYFKDSCDNIDASISHNVTIGVGLEFGTCGTNRMYITNGGNIGIGSSNPADLLHIEKCQAGGVGMIIRNSCGATSNTSMCSLISLQLVGDGQTGQIGVNLIAGKEGDYSSAGVRKSFFAIQTACGDNLYERLRITSCGNVGIGTSSPLAKLTIVKATRSSTLGASSVLQILDASAAGQAVGDRAEINFYTNSDSLGGNLQHATIGIIKTSTTGNETADLYFGTSTIGGSPVERMRIDSAGTVQVKSGSELRVYRSDNARYGTFYNDNSYVHIAASTDPIRISSIERTELYVSGTERMRISSTGVATFTSSTTGLDNITIKNSSGKTNVIIGSAGGTALFGGMQMFDNSSNVAVYLITDSSSNSYVNSGFSIGANLASYKLQISTDSAGKPNGGSWANSSDIRLKENVKTIDNALDKIMQLRGVTFDWKDETEQDNVKSSAGFIADEVMLAFPNWVKEVNTSSNQKELINDDKVKSLSLPFEFDALLVQAIKEQQCTICSQSQKIAILESCLGIM